jgi:hyperosmotically inducible periplasmic protein
MEIIYLKRLALMLVLFLTLFGVSSVAIAQNPMAVSPDNSAINARDRNPQAMTAGQQSNATSDVELTRKIRRAVVNGHSLSMLAHNIKIISANGRVILRGPVKTEQEKTVIESKAQSIAGADKVDSQLEVKSQ